jgi:type I restriction enzyme S subunit
VGEIGSIFNGNSINEKIKRDKYEGMENGFSYIATKDVGCHRNRKNGYGISQAVSKFPDMCRNET